MKHIFIVGCKGIPAAYGGYETFVDRLTEGQETGDLQYHVACASDEKKSDSFCHAAHCFHIRWRKLGAARAIFYDCDALRYCIRYVMKNKIRNPFIVYVLACRIGPFFHYYVKKIHKLGGTVYVNPDGHEWMRMKWSLPVRKYWKLSERLMVKYSDLLICDSKNIEKYIKETYRAYRPETRYIAYGAEIMNEDSSKTEEALSAWYREHGLKAGDYYLVVGRLVPENNYETMIREFMKSKTTKRFALITNVNDRFLEALKAKTGFERDSRICFTGAVYDKELLGKIRKNAFGYFHGHEVGGTNPSLLEALGATDLNLLLDVSFNREVAEKAALYWNKSEGNLAELINRADRLSGEEIKEFGKQAKERISERYSWKKIIREYEMLFMAKREAV